MDIFGMERNGSDSTALLLMHDHHSYTAGGHDGESTVTEACW